MEAKGINKKIPELEFWEMEDEEVKKAEMKEKGARGEEKKKGFRDRRGRVDAVYGV